MTDPRAALAESLEAAGMYEKDDPTEYPGSPIHAEDAADIQKHLAERGVLLERKELREAASHVIQAWHRDEGSPPNGPLHRAIAELDAALSGEVTE